MIKNIKKSNNIFKITILSLSLTISVIFSLLETFLFPKFLATGTLELHFFPLFLINYLFNEYYAFLLASITIVFNFLFVPSSFIVSFWSFLFDYVLSTYCFVFFFFIYNLFFKKKLQYKTLNYFFSYFILIFCIFSLKLFFNTVSGHLFFNVSWIKSLILNSTYNLATFFFFLLIYWKFKNIVLIYHQKYHQNY